MIEDPDFAGLPSTEQNKVLDLLSENFTAYRHKRLATALGITLIPPFMGYILLFVVVPLIARGFRTPNR